MRVGMLAWWTVRILPSMCGARLVQYETTFFQMYRHVHARKQASTHACRIAMPAQPLSCGRTHLPPPSSCEFIANARSTRSTS